MSKNKTIDNSHSNVNAVYDTIKEYAKNPLGDMRVVDNIKTGQFARQGDIYITRIDDPSNDHMAEWKVVEDRQLAPGSSQGSRHTVDATVSVFVTGDNLKAKRNNKGFQVLGPVITSKDRFTVSHPEHALISLPPGSYQVSYQVDPATMKRVMD